MRSQDYEEFLESCDRHEVRYLIVGAHAVAHHARPRATKDFYLWIDPSEENVGRVLDTIRDFLGTDLDLTAEDLTTPDRIVQLGVAPSRIDLLNHIPGAPSFQEAWNRKVEARYGSVDASYLSLEDLIQAKKATGRARDRDDLESLERARGRKDL